MSGIYILSVCFTNGVPVSCSIMTSQHEAEIAPKGPLDPADSLCDGGLSC